MNRKVPLVRGFDDYFMAPHSRHTEVRAEDIRAVKELTILAESEEAGVFLAIADEGRKIFVMGHPEYDRVTSTRSTNVIRIKVWTSKCLSIIIRMMMTHRNRDCSGDHMETFSIQTG